ncbi:MAG TPA: phage holin family protein [Alphaproteobacteria bacterium]|nr:phage holin family protein [Alphaproteobacteria bacterium]
MQPAGDERPIGSLFSDLARDTSALVRTEVQLAKTEIIERVSQFTGGLILLILGGLVLYAAFLVLLFAAALALGHIFNWWATMPWLAPLIVGIVVGAIGAILVMRGKGDVRPANLVPRRTLASIKEDASWARKKVI